MAAISFGLGVGLAAGLSPGPLTALVIAYSLRDGWRSACLVASVPLLTDAPIIALSVFAVSAFSKASPILVAMQVLGGIYLLYLGGLTWRSALPSATAEHQISRPLRDGLIVNWLNPHPWLFWLTVGAPYLRTPANSSLNVMLFLLSFYGTLVGAKIVIAVSFANTGNFLRPTHYVYIMRALGLILAGFGLHLIGSHFEW